VAEIAYEPTFKIIMLANEAPYMPPDNEGMMSRVLIVPYRVTFKKNANPNIPFEKNIDLERLKYFSTPEGKSCILNAWITGLRDFYLNNELTIGKAIQDNTAAFRNELDDVKLFKELATVIDPMGYIVKQDLYTAYQKFRTDEGRTAFILSLKKFNREIRKILERSYPDKQPIQLEGFDSKRENRVWFGIRLRVDSDAITDAYTQHVNENTTLVI
jgi:phage/plasmid-associated DNA primase